VSEWSFNAHPKTGRQPALTTSWSYVSDAEPGIRFSSHVIEAAFRCIQNTAVWSMHRYHSVIILNVACYSCCPDAACKNSCNVVILLLEF